MKKQFHERKKMNVKLKSKFIITGVAMLMFISCQRHEIKADDAYEQVKKEKMQKKDSSLVIPEITQVAEEILIIPKKEKPNEWNKFKTEIDKRIHSNEMKIKEIKEIPNTNNAFFRKVKNLENDNNDLRKKMDEYKEAEKDNWEKFKTTENHEVNEIDIALKDLKVKNKVTNKK